MLFDGLVGKTPPVKGVETPRPNVNNERKTEREKASDSMWECLADAQTPRTFRTGQCQQTLTQCVLQGGASVEEFGRGWEVEGLRVSTHELLQSKSRFLLQRGSLTR